MLPRFHELPQIHRRDIGDREDHKNNIFFSWDNRQDKLLGVDPSSGTDHIQKHEWVWKTSNKRMAVLQTIQIVFEILESSRVELDLAQVAVNVAESKLKLTNERMAENELRRANALQRSNDQIEQMQMYMAIMDGQPNIHYRGLIEKRQQLGAYFECLKKQMEEKKLTFERELEQAKGRVEEINADIKKRLEGL